MDNHPVGWPLLYETPLGMFCLYGKVMHMELRVHDLLNAFPPPCLSVYTSASGCMNMKRAFSGKNWLTKNPKAIKIVMEMAVTEIGLWSYATE